MTDAFTIGMSIAEKVGPSPMMQDWTLLDIGLDFQPPCDWADCDQPALWAIHYRPHCPKLNHRRWALACTQCRDMLLTSEIALCKCGNLVKVTDAVCHVDPINQRKLP